MRPPIEIAFLDLVNMGDHIVVAAPVEPELHGRPVWCIRNEHVFRRCAEIEPGNGAAKPDCVWHIVVGWRGSDRSFFIGRFFKEKRVGALYHVGAGIVRTPIIGPDLKA